MLKNILGDVKGIFNIITLIDMLISLGFIILGIIFYFLPNMSNLVAGILAGSFLVFNGANMIYSFIERGKIMLFNNNIFYGIILVVLGILVMFLKNILAILVGVCFIISGAQKVNYGILFKKFKESSWLITVVIGILYLVLGIICFFAKGDNIVSATGIGILGYGIINLVDIILLRRRSKNFLE